MTDNDVIEIIEDGVPLDAILSKEAEKEIHEAISITLESFKKTRWTPVSESLPEPWESVLITFSRKYGNLTADHAVGIGSWDGSNGWYFEEIEGYTDRLTVEAWMNLPESYKGE